MDERGAWMRKRGPDGKFGEREWVPEAEIVERLHAGWRQAPADVVGTEPAARTPRLTSPAGSGAVSEQEEGDGDGL